MQNEKNNNEHWKKKMNDADFITTETRLNKDVAWQKLAQRLHKPKRKKAILYWAVAACLPPLAIALLLFLHPKNNHDIKGSVSLVRNPTKPIIKATILLPDDKIVTITKLHKNEKKSVVKMKNSNSVLIDTNNEIARNTREDSIGNDDQKMAVIPDENMAKTNVTIVAKPKLKVVHINELGEPDETAPMVAHNNYPHTFSMQIGKEEVYANPAKAKRKNGFVNLPITLSSN